MSCFGFFDLFRVVIINKRRWHNLMMGNKVGRNSLARSSTAQRSDKYPLMRGDGK